jgi:gliding motility-associated-like protein
MRFLISIYLLFPLLGMAQLVTSTAQSPSGLVQNVLLGPGVTVSNINYTGSAQAIGYFDGSATNVGIGEGILLTTGTVNNTGDGPHGPNDQGNSGLINNAGGYGRLSNLVGGTQTFNASVLEFDFVPYSDTVRFSYVFGSEEYPEYVGSDFNDVFAFFISGPGIPGGSQNIARLANGTVVAINNINSDINSSFYNYNGTGSQSPYNSNPFYIQYDGFTDVLEAVSRVQCGQTYHLSIAIADVGDGIYDSGIFLKANSLTSKVPVSINYAISYNAFNDPSMMAEGCVSATVTLTRNTNNLNIPLVIPVTISGNAVSGTDYTNTIPSSVTFAPGQTSMQFSFDALEDGIPEGIENLDLTFAIPDPCGGTTNQTLHLKINDVAPVTVSVESSDVLCPGEEVEMIAVAQGGVGPYTYLWNTGETTSSIFVSPTSSATYTVTIVDFCLEQSATASGTVNVPVYQPLTLTATPDITEICPYVPAIVSVQPAGGAGNYTYQWSTVADGNLGTDSTQEVVPSTTTTYEVLVTDQCGTTATEQVLYTITSPPLVLTMSPAQLICPGDSVQISVSGTGGYGQYYYSWLHSGETTATVWVNPRVTTTYEVSVSDECQTFSVHGTTLVEVIHPEADFRVSSHTRFEDLPITFQNLSTGAISYEWTFGDGQSSTVVHPNNTYDLPGDYTVTLIATNELGCKDTVAKIITIAPEYYVYVPNTFTPDGNRFNNYFSASTVNITELDVKIFNRWGQLVYQSDDIRFTWDGTYAAKNAEDGVYTYKIHYVTISGIEEVIIGHVALLR